MTRTEVAVVALIVVVIAWLLMPPPVVYPDAPTANITPVVCKSAEMPACVGTPPPMITATPHGPLGTPVAELYLPMLEVSR